MIEALGIAASDRDPEVAYRATSALLHHLHATDPDLSYSAQRALLGSSSADTAGSFAARAFAGERRRQEKRALRKLEELGAQIQNQGQSVTLATGWKGGDDGLAWLKWLTRLTTLELKHSQITDKGLRHVRGLSGLETLSLSRSSYLPGPILLGAAPESEDAAVAGDVARG